MPTKKELNIYGDLVYEHRPGIRVLLIAILQEKLFNLKRQKQSFYKDDAAFVPKQDLISQLPLKYMAVVSNQEVVEMIRINEQTADILLSKKTKLVEFDPTTTIVKKGMQYIDKTFIDSKTNNSKEENIENTQDNL
jgi:hypothetical protein